MARRSATLQRFVEAALQAFEHCAREPASRRSIASIFAALNTPGPTTSGAGQRVPACSHLDEAVEIAGANPVLRDLVEAFRRIEPFLQWRRRRWEASASENFFEGHANAMIFGPGGLEERSDIWLGVTLMAPGTRYPDHDHAPEETYLVLSEGDFQHGGSTWFVPGVGGSFYNPPGIRHAMRSGRRPLFALWALWAGSPSQAHHAATT